MEGNDIFDTSSILFGIISDMIYIAEQYNPTEITSIKDNIKKEKAFYSENKSNFIKDNAIYTHDTSAGEKVGFIIIDNLRMTCYGNSAIIVNAWDKVTIGGTGDQKYFIRECVCGTINSVSYAISDETYGTLYMGQKNNNGNNLCYINPIAQGDVVVTITYNLGYLHETVIAHTVTLHVQ